MYDRFTKPTNKDIMNELISVQLQVEAITEQVTKMLHDVEEESIKMQYVNAERIIVEALRCYNNFLNMTEPDDIYYWRREFLKWGGMVRESTTYLLDGVLGRGMISSDILKTIVNIVGNSVNDFAVKLI